MSSAEIARMLLADESHVRKVIHDFNERGFESLRRPRCGGGRPRRISIDDEQRIAVSPAQLARLLARAGLSFQRTRSWKASPDPGYEARAARVLALYREQPVGGVAISFDEMGPVSVRPQPGWGWACKARPERQRATYSRRHGVRHLVGPLDVYADYLRARLKPAAMAPPRLEFMRQIRLAYPRSR